MKRSFGLLVLLASLSACAAAQRTPTENELCGIAGAASPVLNGLVDEFIAIVNGGGAISDQSETYVAALEQLYHVGDAVLCPPAPATPGAQRAAAPRPSARLHAFLLAHPGHTFAVPARGTP